MGDPVLAGPCACHGVPKLWRRRNDCKAGGKWVCGVDYKRAQADYMARERLRRAAEGLCQLCGKDVAITVARCFDCLRNQDEYNAMRVQSR